MADATDTTLLRAGLGCSFHLPSRRAEDKQKKVPVPSSPSSSSTSAKSLSGRVSVVSAKDVFKAASKGQVALFGFLCLLSLVGIGLILAPLYYSYGLKAQAEKAMSERSSPVPSTDRGASPVSSVGKVEEEEDDDDDSRYETIEDRQAYKDFITQAADPQKSQQLTVCSTAAIPIYHSLNGCKSGKQFFVTHARQASEKGMLPQMQISEDELNNQLLALNDYFPDVVFGKMGDKGSSVPTDSVVMMELMQENGSYVNDISGQTRIEILAPEDGSFVFKIWDERCIIRKMKPQDELRSLEDPFINIAAYKVDRRVTVRQPNQGKIVVEQERTFTRVPAQNAE